jgi:hypothetical protein
MTTNIMLSYFFIFIQIYSALSNTLSIASEVQACDAWKGIILTSGKFFIELTF